MNEIIFVLFTLVLFAVFIMAGIAKLLDRSGSRKAIIDFGIPSRVGTYVASLLPFAELGVAGLLLSGVYTWFGAVSGLILLVIFSATLGFNLLVDRKPSCHCFGNFHSSPISWKTLLRNLVLVAISGFIVLQGPTYTNGSVIDWSYSVYSASLSVDKSLWVFAGIVLIGFVLTQTWFLTYYKRQNQLLHQQISELEKTTKGRKIQEDALVQTRRYLPIKSAAPQFQTIGIDGKTYTLSSLTSLGKPVLLIFSDPNCGPCNRLLPNVSRWQREHFGQVTIAIITRGSKQTNLKKANQYGLNNILLQVDREISHLYNAYGTPSGILIDNQGNIASKLALGIEQISMLVESMVTQHPATDDRALDTDTQFGNSSHHLQFGFAMDRNLLAIKLTDPKGHSLDALEFLPGGNSDRKVILFWSPYCNHCRPIIQYIKRWEINYGTPVSNLLLVSVHEDKQGQLSNLLTKVAYDYGFKNRNALSIPGTPTAILVNNYGKIISDPVSGTSAVLGLVDRLLEKEEGNSIKAPSLVEQEK